MSNLSPRVLIASFLISLVCFSIWSGANTPTAPFERLGVYWVLVKSAYCAFVIQLSYLVVSNVLRRRNSNLFKGFRCAIYLAVLLIADRPIVQQSDETPLDLFIRFLGYEISCITPYQPHDSAGGSKFQPVLTSDSSVSAITLEGAVTLYSYYGRLRKFHFGNVNSPESVRFFEVADDVDKFGNRAYTFNSDNLPTGYCWKSLEGFTRCRYIESRLNFQSVDQAKLWIRQLKNHDLLPLVYSTKGLLVGMYKSRTENLLVLQVHQILINGKRAYLPDGNDFLVTTKPIDLPKKIESSLLDD